MNSPKEYVEHAQTLLRTQMCFSFFLIVKKNPAFTNPWKLIKTTVKQTEGVYKEHQMCPFISRFWVTWRERKSENMQNTWRGLKWQIQLRLTLGIYRYISIVSWVTWKKVEVICKTRERDLSGKVSYVWRKFSPYFSVPLWMRHKWEPFMFFLSFFLSLLEYAERKSKGYAEHVKRI